MATGHHEAWGVGQPVWSAHTPQRVLITGGSGYFGSILRDRLSLAGHPVKCFDLLDSPDRPAAVAFVPGDIRDAHQVGRACEGADWIFHCVAQVPLARSAKLFNSV